MNKLNFKIVGKYFLYILLAVVFTSCNFMEGERNYNKRNWEIKKMRLELDYLKDLHNYKKDLEIEKKISDIDSLISNYR